MVRLNRLKTVHHLPSSDISLFKLYWIKKNEKEDLVYELSQKCFFSSHLDSELAFPLRSPSSIRHYIQNLKVIDNQRKLTQLSRTIEC